MQEQPFLLNEIQSARLSVILDSNNNIRGAIFISAIYARFGIIKNAIFAYTLKGSLEEKNSAEESFSITPCNTYIDFGIDPDVKLIEYNNTVFVLEVNKFFYLPLHVSLKMFDMHFINKI